MSGMIPTKEMTEHVPVTEDEIIYEVLNLASIGVSIVHIHARENGKPTWKKEIYKRIIGGIREKNEDIILCVTTSGRDWQDFERRSEVLDLEGDYKPDMASLTLGSMNFIKTASMNAPSMIRDLAKKMKDNGIKPELEAFDVGMAKFANRLVKEGLLDKPYMNILLGNMGTAPADIGTMSSILDVVPNGTICAFAGIGVFSFPVHVTSIMSGTHVRVGLEDNIFFDIEKKTLASNADLVDRIKHVAGLIGRKIENPVNVRLLFGIG